jgi:hypothetical protein
MDYSYLQLYPRATLKKQESPNTDKLLTVGYGVVKVNLS